MARPPKTSAIVHGRPAAQLNSTHNAKQEWLTNPDSAAQALFAKTFTNRRNMLTHGRFLFQLRLNLFGKDLA
jgi:hypothetical protein